MNFPAILLLNQVASTIFLKYREAEQERSYVHHFVSAHSILDSGWDFHSVSTTIAGVLNQFERKGAIQDAGCLRFLGSFRFMSDEILTAYFPQPEKCPLFIAHLFLQQQLLEACLVIIQDEADHT